MHIDMSGKRVVVTGGTRGIGRAIAQLFAKSGASVAVCARSQDGIAKAVPELQTFGRPVIGRVVDVGDTAQAKMFIDAIVEAWGGVDVLVNNAGQGRGGNIDTLAPESILEHANLLQVAHFRMAQAVVPHMRKQRWGRIIAINALAGSVIPPDGIPAVTNRAAGIAMARSLGQALAKDNILVNTLNMGWIDTGQWERHYKEMPPTISREEFFTMVTKVVPLGRFGKPEEVAGLAVFLASDYANYISAASIDVSGGMLGQISYYPTLKKELHQLGLDRQKTNATRQVEAQSRPV